MKVALNLRKRLSISYDMVNYLLDHGVEQKQIDEIRNNLFLGDTVSVSNFFHRSIRTDPMIIEAIENTNDHNNYIKEIPDEVTDFLVIECNGYEELYYVLNGKLHNE